MTVVAGASASASASFTANMYNFNKVLDNLIISIGDLQVGQLTAAAVVLFGLLMFFPFHFVTAILILVGLKWCYSNPDEARESVADAAQGTVLESAAERLRPLPKPEPKESEKQIFIKTRWGGFLSAKEGQRAIVDAVARHSRWECFYIVNKGNGRCNIKTVHGTVLSASDTGSWWQGYDGEIHCVWQTSKWEEFTMEPHNESFAFKTCHGTYLSVPGGKEGTRAVCKRTNTLSDEQLFWVGKVSG